MGARATPHCNAIAEFTANFFLRHSRGTQVALSHARYYLALRDASKISSRRRLSISAPRETAP
jgi:hypothetical protein